MAPYPLLFRLMQLMRQFSVASDRYVDQVAAMNRLHRTDLNALALLVDPRDAPLTPSRLRDALNLSSPATTALLDRLEGAGHVTRRRSEGDRRQVQLAMTDHARAVGKTLFSPLGAEMTAALEAYSQPELELIGRFLEDAVRATEAARDSLSEPGNAARPAGETADGSTSRSAGWSTEDSADAGIGGQPPSELPSHRRSRSSSTGPA